MDPELKSKWVAALRSGEYKQCRGECVDPDGKRCALGVLAAVAGIDDAVVQNDYTPFDNLVGDDSDSIWRMNDHEGFTFNQIATYIEENL